MDDVDPVVLEHRVVALVDGREALRAGPLGARPDHARHLHAEAPERVHVDDADEACPDDRGLELVDSLHTEPLAAAAASRFAWAWVRRRTTRSVRRTCLRASAPAREASPERIASTMGTWKSARSDWSQYVQ